jgi:hypothetical protein
MRPLLVFAVLGLCLPSMGCQLCVNGPRNILFELCDRTSDLAESKRNRRLAREAWADECAAKPDNEFSEDYAAGFEDGFVDYLEAGETAEPLPMLPAHYQKLRYQTPEGTRAIEDWVDGFRHGAAAAQEGGYREQVILPRALFVPDPVAAQPPEDMERPQPVAEGLASNESGQSGPGRTPVFRTVPCWPCKPAAQTPDAR